MMMDAFARRRGNLEKVLRHSTAMNRIQTAFGRKM
jgi:hypothetical protein